MIATIVGDRTAARARDSRFFEINALLMALILISGFSLHLAMGRSSFSLPIFMHVHAVVFFGWVFIFVAQTFLGTRGPISLHRKLGWLAAGWVVAMVVVGCAIALWRIQAGTVPFFFQPQYFLIANPMTLFVFAGLTAAAVVMRHSTDWHRRLHVCAMAMLLGPGIGRLLPTPLLIPWAFQIAVACGLLFPLAGMIRDWVRSGRVHPAWLWGVGTAVLAMLAVEAITYSPLGDALFAWAVKGTAGAALAPLEFGPMPPMG